MEAKTDAATNWKMFREHVASRWQNSEVDNERDDDAHDDAEMTFLTNFLFCLKLLMVMMYYGGYH